MKALPPVPMLMVPASVCTDVMCPFPAAAALKISLPSSVIPLDLVQGYRTDHTQTIVKIGGPQVDLGRTGRYPVRSTVTLA